MARISIQFSLFSAFYPPLISTMSGGFLAAEGLDPEWSVAPPGAAAVERWYDFPEFGDTREMPVRSNVDITAILTPGMKRSNAQRGVTLLEIMIVLAAAGFLAGSALITIGTITNRKNDSQNEIVLETARTALIAFAGANGGCLPFAADYEGGLSNTDQNGAPSPGTPDTGIGRADSHAGDLPWAELGLGNNFLDADGLRVQYYVASYYTDLDADLSNGIACTAGHRGARWDSRITYDGTVEPRYVYYSASGTVQELYRIDGVLPAGTPPDTVSNSIADAVSSALPDSLLELRRGPRISGQNGQNDVLSAQNVFVLIATGTNINPSTNINLPNMRDGNHKGNQGNKPWKLNEANVDKVRFAATPEIDSADLDINGDDTLLVESFLSFKRSVFAYGVRLEPLWESAN